MSMGEALFPALQALIAFAAGMVLGLGYFALLSRNLQLYFDGRSVAGAALQLARFLLIAACLYGAAQFGAVPLLSCAAGALAGRHVILRRARQVP